MAKGDPEKLTSGTPNLAERERKHLTEPEGLTENVANLPCFPFYIPKADCLLSPRSTESLCLETQMNPREDLEVMKPQLTTHPMSSKVSQRAPLTQSLDRSISVPPLGMN